MQTPTLAANPSRTLRPSRPWLGGLVVCAVLAVGSIAHAQPNDGFNLDKVISRGPAPKKGPENPLDRKQIKPPDATPVQADVQWGLRRGATDPKARARHTHDFVELSHKVGDPTLPYHALAVIEEARQASDADSPQLAESLVEEAETLAPGTPNASFAHAALTLRHSPTSVFRIIGEVETGWERLGRWLPLRYAAMARGSELAVVALAAVALLLLLVALYRHLRLLAADLGRVLPSGPSTAQLSLLVLLLIAAPGVVFGSPGLSIAAGLVLFAAYMGWNERLVALLVLGALSTVPMLARHGEAGLDFGGSAAHQLWRQAAVGCDEACIEELRGVTVEGEPPAHTAVRHMVVANGLLRRSRTADYAEPIRRYDAVLKDPTLPVELLSVARNNLAVARAMEGRSDDAIGLLGAASAERPTSWAPLFNLYRLHDDARRSTEAQASLDKAIQLGGKEVVDKSQVEERTLNLWYAIESIPTGVLAEAHEARERDGAWMADRWAVGLGGLELGSVSWMGPGAAGLFLVLLLLGWVLRASQRCPRCGLEMQSRRPGPREEIKGVCHTCRTCFGGGKMTYQQKVEHEDIAQAYETRCRWVFRIGNVMVPGLGSALRGYGVGLWAVVLLALGVAWLLGTDAWVPATWQISSLWFDGISLLGWLLIAVGTIVGWIGFWLGDSGAPERTDAAEIVGRELP